MIASYANTPAAASLPTTVTFMLNGNAQLCGALPPGWSTSQLAASSGTNVTVGTSIGANCSGNVLPYGNTCGASTAWAYLGCFNNGSLPVQLMTSPTVINVSACTAAASAAGYNMIGIGAAFTKCWACTSCNYTARGAASGCVVGGGTTTIQVYQQALYVAPPPSPPVRANLHSSSMMDRI